jgi:MoxR-like ATPase
LPEAQLDRFLICIRVDYPSPEEEEQIVIGTTGPEEPLPAAVIHAKEIVELQGFVRAVPVSKDVIAYAVRLAGATRPDSANGSTPDAVKDYVTCGASPRASQSLILAAKAKALLAGRFHVDFADVAALAPHVLRHRLILNYRSRADKVSADDVVKAVLEKTPKERPESKPA